MFAINLFISVCFSHSVCEIWIVNRRRNGTKSWFNDVLKQSEWVHLLIENEKKTAMGQMLEIVDKPFQYESANWVRSASRKTIRNLTWFNLFIGQINNNVLHLHLLPLQLDRHPLNRCSRIISITIGFKKIKFLCCRREAAENANGIAAPQTCISYTKLYEPNEDSLLKMQTKRWVSTL